MKRKNKKINVLKPGGWVQTEMALEIAPGTYVLDGDLAEDALTEWVFCKVKFDPQTKRFVPIGISLEGHYMNVDEISDKLGIGPSRNTLYRLFHAGFIEGRQITPTYIEINIQSLARHLKNARDRGFWTKERRRRYRQALH